MLDVLAAEVLLLGLVSPCWAGHRFHYALLKGKNCFNRFHADFKHFSTTLQFRLTRFLNLAAIADVSTRRWNQNVSTAKQRLFENQRSSGGFRNYTAFNLLISASLVCAMLYELSDLALSESVTGTQLCCWGRERATELRQIRHKKPQIGFNFLIWPVLQPNVRNGSIRHSLCSLCFSQSVIKDLICIKIYCY